jgi:hypothetical protein
MQGPFGEQGDILGGGGGDAASGGEGGGGGDAGEVEAVSASEHNPHDFGQSIGLSFSQTEQPSWTAAICEQDIGS